MSDKIVLKDEEGNMMLPVDGKLLLDAIVVYATKEIQNGTDVNDIIETLHDATCFWLLNHEQQEELYEQHKRSLN